MQNSELIQDYSNLQNKVAQFTELRKILEDIEPKEFQELMNHKLQLIREEKAEIWDKIDRTYKTFSEGKYKKNQNVDTFVFCIANGNKIFESNGIAGNFCCDRAYILEPDGDYYYYDTTGKKLFGGFLMAWDFSCDRGLVRKKDLLYYFYDPCGNELFGGFVEAQVFNQDTARVRKPNESWSTVDLDGNKIA